MPSGLRRFQRAEFDLDLKWTASLRGNRSPEGVQPKEGERSALPPNPQEARLGWGTIHRGRTGSERTWSGHPPHPGQLLPALDCGDHLHPNPAGYKAMGAAIPLDLFKR